MDEADKERLYEPVKAKRANLELHRQGIDLCILYIDVSICMYTYVKKKKIIVLARKNFNNNNSPYQTTLSYVLSNYNFLYSKFP